MPFSDFAQNKKMVYLGHMDMKELNKSQLILLALLISFVTSIATGISTVTLMQQAPKSVTVPINRIVQETIEKVVPGSTTAPQTVIIKEEDLVVDAIAKNEPAVFTITKNTTNDFAQTIQIPAGRGFAIAKDGTIVADASFVPDDEPYFVTNSSGTFKASFVSTDKAGFSLLKIGAPVDGKSIASFTVPDFGDITKMKAGQRLLLLDPSFTSFTYDGMPDLKLKVPSASVGSPLVDLDGDVVGIALGGNDISFASIQAITAAMKPVVTPISTTPVQ